MVTIDIRRYPQIFSVLKALNISLSEQESLFNEARRFINLVCVFKLGKEVMGKL